MDTPKKHTRHWLITGGSRAGLFLSVLLLVVVVCAGAPRAYANESDGVADQARQAMAGEGENAVQVTIQVRTVLESLPLLEDTFDFVLADSAGTRLQTARNASDGSVTFEPLSFTTENLDRSPDTGEPIVTTLTYTVSEVPGTDDEMLYCTGIIKATVTLTPQSDGAPVADVSYAYSYGGQSFEATSDPCFANRYSTITIHTVKRSREEPHDPLPGVHLGLWMVNPGGEDFYMGLGRNQEEKEGSECESSDNGDLYHDVPRIMGVAYYFLEEWPPPAGHLVDPYPSDYFTLVIEGDSYRIVYETDPDFSQYAPGVASVTPPGPVTPEPTPSPVDPSSTDPADPPSEDDDDPSQMQTSEPVSPTSDEPDPASPVPTSDEDTSTPNAQQPDLAGTADETPATPSTSPVPECDTELAATAQRPNASRPYSGASMPKTGTKQEAEGRGITTAPPSRASESPLADAGSSQTQPSESQIADAGSSQTSPTPTRRAGIARVLPFALCGLLILLGAIATAAYLRTAARDDR